MFSNSVECLLDRNMFHNLIVLLLAMNMFHNLIVLLLDRNMFHNLIVLQKFFFPSWTTQNDNTFAPLHVTLNSANAPWKTSGAPQVWNR